jgi:hypothetical protein
LKDFQDAPKTRKVKRNGKEYTIDTTKKQELIYHGNNALAMPLESGLQAIGALEDAVTVRRMSIELRLMRDAMDLRQADTATAVAERDEARRKLMVWSLRLNARIAELYDAVKDAPMGGAAQHPDSLTAVNESDTKTQFLDDVGVTRVTVTRYRKLAAHTERLT